MFNNHLARLKKILGLQSIPAVLITSPSDVFYLSGLLAEGLIMVVRPGSHCFFTTLMFKDYASSHLPGAKVRVYSNLFESLSEFIGESKIRKISVNKNSITVEQAEKLRKIRHCRISFDASLLDELRAVKKSEELNRIRQACRITARLMKIMPAFLKVGSTEMQIAGKINTFFAQYGLHNAFQSIVAFGSHTAEPHHVSGMRKLKKSDPIMIDAGARFKGYCADLTRMFYLGKIDGFYSQIYQVVREAKAAAQALVKPGVTVSKIDEAARAVFKGAGYEKFFVHSTGHGVGIDVHELPLIGPHSNTVLKPGMVITIEPGLYVPRRCGVRIEDTLLVTPEGSEILTR